MNTGTAKTLRKMCEKPPKSFLDELSKIHGEDEVLDGKINLYREAKKLWKTKNHKEKETAWKV